jgi:hypothetical protein
MIHFLEQTFTGKGEVAGFLFERVYTAPTFYVYKVKAETKEYYEVFKRTFVPLCVDFAAKIYSQNEFKEVYPKANKFGVSAFTTDTLEKAIKIGENHFC